jgi:hypothetical protein
MPTGWDFETNLGAFFSFFWNIPFGVLFLRRHDFEQLRTSALPPSFALRQAIGCCVLVRTQYPTTGLPSSTLQAGFLFFVDLVIWGFGYLLRDK